MNQPPWQPEEDDVPITFTVEGTTLRVCSTVARARADQHLEGAPGWTEVHLSTSIREAPTSAVDEIRLMATVTLWLRPDPKSTACRSSVESEAC